MLCRSSDISWYTARMALIGEEEVSMRLRKLELKDAPFMLEWMHDESVVENLQTRFGEKTMEDCELFITNSLKDRENLHLAIVDDTDTYMGTISLKHITDDSAEFGITIRRCAMGQGYAKRAMEIILQKGLQDMKLKQIYWCVNPQNRRAIRFYDKNRYQKIDHLDSDTISMLCEAGIYNNAQIEAYIWYQIKI